MFKKILFIIISFIRLITSRLSDFVIFIVIVGLFREYSLSPDELIKHWKEILEVLDRK